MITAWWEEYWLLSVDTSIDAILARMNDKQSGQERNERRWKRGHLIEFIFYQYMCSQVNYDQKWQDFDLVVWPFNIPKWQDSLWWYIYTKNTERLDNFSVVTRSIQYNRVKKGFLSMNMTLCPETPFAGDRIPSRWGPQLSWKLVRGRLSAKAHLHYK